MRLQSFGFQILQRVVDLITGKRLHAERTTYLALRFLRYGVWGDWSEPYVTLQPKYEAAQLGVFGKMVLNGHIYRGRKPVHWSPSSRTALAEAELEYPEGHKSRSIYVALPLAQVKRCSVFELLFQLVRYSLSSPSRALHAVPHTASGLNPVQ